MHHYNQRKRTAFLLICSLLPLVCLAQQRSKAEALSVAQSFCESNLSKKEKLGAFVKTSSELSRSEKLSTTKEAYYIFNAQDKGFVIVSGDERMPNILAYSDDSSFRYDELPPATRYWLDCFEETYLHLSDSFPSSSSELEFSMAADRVEPLLGKTQWGQGPPFNSLCPRYANQNCLTGCVATAMAQVMRFYGYPYQGMGQSDYYTSTNHLHVYRDLSKDFYDWESMLDNYSKVNYQEANAVAVATLMASCGAAVKMDYGTNEQGGSGAYQTDLLSAYVDNFGYDPDAAVLARAYFPTKEWHDFLIRELDEGRPVNYAGHSPRDGGHSFVLDGYRVSSTSAYPDYHVNWGWNGSCDGYYQIADLLPKENGQNAAMDGFNNSQQMTIGIRPDDGIDQNRIILATEKLHISNSVAMPGRTIQVYTASMCNFSYRDFSGNVSVSLIDDNNIEYILETNNRIKSLTSLQIQKNISYEVVVPQSVPEGTYKVSLKAEDSKHAIISVFSSNYPQLIISSNGETPDYPSTVSTVLGCSDIEILDPVDDEYEIRLNIYELQNLEESPFIGDLRMILADEYGKVLSAFGDSIQPGELGMFEVQPDPFMLRGVLSEDLADGIYRIYIGARPINSTDFHYISFYDFTQPFMEPQELYFDLRKENGEILIDGHKYKPQPLEVPTIVCDSKKLDTVVTIGGFRFHRKNVASGIIIENNKKYIMLH